MQLHMSDERRRTKRERGEEKRNGYTMHTFINPHVVLKVFTVRSYIPRTHYDQPTVTKTKF